MTIRIDYLADHPDQIGTLARWHFEEWQTLIPDWSFAAAERELAGHVEREAIPTTLVALARQEMIGSASLLVEDFPQWAELTPWVASVYVAPAWRSRGVGTRLVTEAVRLAAKLGVPTLYLATPGQAHFYQRIGWSVVDDLASGDRGLTLMKRPTR